MLRRLLTTLCAAAFALFSADAAAPDLILHDGKVVTVDDAFSTREAVAV